jgi:hypothetical protein
MKGECADAYSFPSGTKWSRKVCSVCWQGVVFGVCVFWSLGLLKEREVSVVSSGVGIVCMVRDVLDRFIKIGLARPS